MYKKEIKMKIVEQMERAGKAYSANIAVLIRRLLPFFADNLF